ncbi:DUF2283 domain-containing protein [Dermacoccus barathri]|uniref:DUF2283 domain-containing protein n=1 Tax=Dermacoccus abyssi TaxID=322596 RepID=A0ABX5ZCE4_9MICO|nr:DUF2283 domain-containing protein [Dermacoccus barathri]QEH94543.1 DUF2283 domain-containing protein [Dermacoccus abyssi]
MRLAFDGEADAAYVALGPDPGAGGVTRTVPVELGGEPGIDLALDVDANGRLVGVEVLGASRLLAPEVLAAAHRLDD